MAILRGLFVRTTWLLLVGLVAVCGAATASAQEAKKEPEAQENWATARARLLTEQGVAHRKSGHADAAVSRLLEAISIDGTFGPAYLALASLREASGEWEEALHVLDMGIDRITGFDEGLVARAAVLTRAKQYASATAAYLTVLQRHSDDEASLRQLLVVAPRASLLPVALGASRRLMALCRERADAPCEKEARLTTRALESLIAEADPVTRGAKHGDRVRRALSRSSR